MHQWLRCEGHLVAGTGQGGALSLQMQLPLNAVSLCLRCCDRPQAFRQRWYARPFSAWRVAAAYTIETVVPSAGVSGSGFTSGEVGNGHSAVGAGGVIARASPEQLAHGVTGPRFPEGELGALMKSSAAQS